MDGETGQRRRFGVLVGQWGGSAVRRSKAGCVWKQGRRRTDGWVKKQVKP